MNFHTSTQEDFHYYKLVKRKKIQQKSSPISTTLKKESLDLPTERDQSQTLQGLQSKLTI